MATFFTDQSDGLSIYRLLVLGNSILKTRCHIGQVVNNLHTKMLPMRVQASAGARRRSTPGSPQQRLQRVHYVLLSLLVVTALYALRFVFSKCDTRATMSVLLTKTTTILQRNKIEYWLDKGTLLGVHRDDGLIPWEYDVDLGVMNHTCDEISKLKSQFTDVGLTAYDRSDYIPHKVKLTYDTENHNFYWSDPYMHDPCIRVYDTDDVSTWVDIYWYIELDLRTVAAEREQLLIPQSYDWNSSLLCCSEGMLNYTEHLCCGGCVPKDTVFPLRKQHVTVSDGHSPVQQQYVPAQIPEFLSIQYGSSALTSREIKGWKGVVCGYWTNPVLFAIELVLFVVALTFLTVFCRRQYLARDARSKRSH